MTRANHKPIFPEPLFPTMRYMKILAYTIILFFALMNFAGAAEPPKVESILFAPPPLNRDITLQRSDFDKQTILVNETPLNDPSLAFSVRLPPSWKKINSVSIANATQSPDVFDTLVEYVSPDTADSRSSFRVRVATLPFAISAKNWVLKFIVTNNYTLQGLEEVNEKRIAAQYVYVDNGTQHVSRMVTTISGTRVIMAEMIMPVSVWAEMRDNAVWSMITFKMNVVSDTPMEEMLTYTMANTVSFNYPKSWLLYKDPIRSAERMNAVLVNVRGGSEGRTIESQSELMALELDGRMDITSFVKTDAQSLATEMATLKKDLTAMGFELGDYISELKIPVMQKSILQSRHDVYKISSNRLRILDYELWISVIETKDRYVIIRTLSIGRHNDFYAWARNLEALKLFLRSLVIK